jgi:hypothetical protein
MILTSALLMLGVTASADVPTRGPRAAQAQTPDPGTASPGTAGTQGTTGTRPSPRGGASGSSSTVTSAPRKPGAAVMPRDGGDVTPSPSTDDQAGTPRR